MTKSMTAYARASGESPLGKLVIELHSVNRKQLDVTVQFPKEWLRFEAPLRKLISTTLERGQVLLRLCIEPDPTSLSHEVHALKALKEHWEGVCKALGCDVSVVDLKFLLAQSAALALGVSAQEEKIVEQQLHLLVSQALETLMQMKHLEGERLASDIQARLELISNHLAAVEKKKELPFTHYKKKLEARFQEISTLTPEIEERIGRELVVLAEKMDVTEEVVRLRSHLQQFHQHLASKERSVGRTLDFLTQEMHREINTIGSKSSDSDISLWVVGMKTELERVREQVQNIE